MYEEPNNLLTQEFKNASIYGDVISAIANGAHRVVEIQDKTKLENASIHNILDKLMKTRIVEKRHAITDEKNNKKTQYVLMDGAFIFWYKFIPRAIPSIEIGNGKDYYENRVKPYIHDYMKEIFEKMCRYYLLLNGFSKDMPCSIYEVGKWYGSHTKKKEQTDIDVVGLDTVENKAVLGECKFRNIVVDKSVLDSLKERNGLIDRKYRTVAYYLFSLSGFSKWYNDNTDDTIRTICIDQMYDR